jgi:soluble lytic murein transglycosylase-like protein
MKISLAGILIQGALLLGGASAAFAQSVYSYVDENGIRVFTNIPPKRPPADLTRLDGRGGREQSAAGPALAEGDAMAPALAQQAPAAGGDPDLRAKYNPIIDKYSDLYRLDPDLVRSVIQTESGFNPRAVSRKGARGLMQLMPGTAARLGVRNSFDPEDNIEAGTRHLRTLLDTFDNNLVLSLAAYNAGENLVQRIGKIPNYPETHSYVRKITQLYGSSEMAAAAFQSPPKTPEAYRFIDSTGTVHYTNLPPSRIFESAHPIVLSASGQD